MKDESESILSAILLAAALAVTLLGSYAWTRLRCDYPAAIHAIEKAITNPINGPPEACGWQTK